LNFNTLARVTLQAAQSGRTAAEISSEDIERLPDLGSTFNDTWVWRYYVRKLKEEDFHLSHQSSGDR
jgi:3,4-dihydroxyphthalate decarboxylase